MRLIFTTFALCFSLSSFSQSIKNQENAIESINHRKEIAESKAQIISISENKSFLFDDNTVDVEKEILGNGSLYGVQPVETDHISVYSIDEINILKLENELLGLVIRNVNDIYTKSAFLESKFPKFVRASVKTKDHDIKLFCYDLLADYMLEIELQKHGINESLIMYSSEITQSEMIDLEFSMLECKIDYVLENCRRRVKREIVRKNSKRANEYLQFVYDDMLYEFQQLKVLSYDLNRQLLDRRNRNLSIITNSVTNVKSDLL